MEQAIKPEDAIRGLQLSCNYFGIPFEYSKEISEVNGAIFATHKVKVNGKNAWQQTDPIADVEKYKAQKEKEVAKATELVEKAQAEIDLVATVLPEVTKQSS